MTCRLAPIGFVLTLIALAVVGCGVRGPLEPPPHTSHAVAVSTQPILAVREPALTVEQAARKADADAALRAQRRAEHPYGETWQYPYRPKLLAVETPQAPPPGPIRRTPHKAFVLDPLLD